MRSLQSLIRFNLQKFAEISLQRVSFIPLKRWIIKSLNHNKTSPDSIMNLSCDRDWKSLLSIPSEHLELSQNNQLNRSINIFDKIFIVQNLLLSSTMSIFCFLANKSYWTENLEIKKHTLAVQNKIIYISRKLYITYHFLMLPPAMIDVTFKGWVIIYKFSVHLST